ncbi:RagB/SusD family nutrient uptake outer membrane protein [Prolixibacteraceae bacterium JC049]|nr:RagB/SusD family nutrient uptake outer membrane protein [Prolixibacteraceae bacterium JC049]
MKKIYLILIVGVLATLFSMSSCDYLEENEFLYEVDDLNDIWSTRQKLRQAQAACYGFIPPMHDMRHGWPFSGGGDEGYPGLDTYTSNLLFKNGFTSDNIPGPLQIWRNGYKAIRTCNMFLANAHKCKDRLLEEGELDRYIAEVKFLKAYYYATILECYGPFVIVDGLVDFATKEMPTIRTPYDECVEYIVKMLDESVANLYEPGKEPRSEAGRVTQGAALALKARVLLTAASPLVNGNTDYADFVDHEGKQLINQTYDEKKWERAANACKELMDKGWYDIHTVPTNSADYYRTVPLGDFPGNDVEWPNGPAGIDPYLSYKSLFAGGEEKYYWNSEAIFQVERGHNALLTRMGFPRNHPQHGSAPVFAMVNCSQKLVDAFFMNNGKTIGEEVGKLYTDRGYAPEGDHLYIWGTRKGNHPENGTPFDELSPIKTNWLTADYQSDLKKGYAPADAVPVRCLNRSARFYAIVGFHGRGYKVNRNDFPVYYADYSKGGNEGYIETDRGSARTGFTIAKWINDEDAQGAGNFNKQLPVLRLAEIYLSYAEALNEYNPGNPEILTYLNKIRFRSGLPGYESMSQDEMREKIKHERFVEMAFEGRRYFDVRRWKDAEKTEVDQWGHSKGEGGPVVGADYKNPIKINFLERTVIDGYIFKRKNYFLPLEYVEVANHWGTLIQNPGW